MKERVIKIGVTYTGTDEKHSNYVKWLKGSDSITISTLSPGRTDMETVRHLDGIVLSGGIDMHPKYYQSSITNYPNNPGKFHELRDEFEMEIYRISHENNIPVLGVCRGMQLINCILGGTLRQDNGITANAIHQYEHNDKAHGINIVANTLLSQVAGVKRSVVNSAHHQSIDLIGKGLVINCTSDDGIIEGLEWADKAGKPFFMAVQWHPERMYKLNLGESPLTKNIRDRFVEEIKIVNRES